MTDNNFHADLVAALSEITNPPMTQENPHFRSKFSSLKDCINTIRPVLAKHHIAATQMVRHGEAGDRVVTRLVHVSGEFVEDGGIPLANTSDPQKMGSAMTYARRYGLLAICGAVGDPDDDGNKASEPEPVLAAPVIKPAVSDDDYVLVHLNNKKLTFDTSKAWVDAYTVEMRNLVNDKKMNVEERIKCMEMFEQKNTATLGSIADGAAADLKAKRQQANDMLRSAAA